MISTVFQRDLSFVSLTCCSGQNCRLNTPTTSQSNETCCDFLIQNLILLCDWPVCVTDCWKSVWIQVRTLVSRCITRVLSRVRFHSFRSPQKVEIQILHNVIHNSQNHGYMCNPCLASCTNSGHISIFLYCFDR